MKRDNNQMPGFDFSVDLRGNNEFHRHCANHPIRGFEGGNQEPYSKRTLVPTSRHSENECEHHCK